MVHKFTQANEQRRGSAEESTVESTSNKAFISATINSKTLRNIANPKELLIRYLLSEVYNDDDSMKTRKRGITIQYVADRKFSPYTHTTYVRCVTVIMLINEHVTLFDVCTFVEKKVSQCQHVAIHKAHDKL
jgi:hypothetical protein